MSLSGRIVIAGGSGFIGLNLARHLASLGAQPVLLSRTPPAQPTPFPHVPWDAHSFGPWTAALEGASALVNLTGRTVDCIKTPDHCDEILRSRVEPTLLLGRALRAVAAPPPVWLQMSTAHIYGDPPDRLCDEDSPFGYGLAPTVGRAWEAAFAEALPASTRGVILRTSFVLARHGGALTKMALLARCGLGGRVGRGRQGISWIHHLDLSRLFAHALADPSMTGAYIATAPNPISQADFMRELRGVLRVPLGLPAPAWLTRLGAKYLMKTDPGLILYGRYIHSTRLAQSSFNFQYPALPAALDNLYGPS